MKRYLLGGVLALLSGCFWHSSAPDLYREDRPDRLVVFWDHKVSEKRVQRKVWQSRDPDMITEMARQLDVEEYRPVSLLLNGGPTRIIFEMASGHVWEWGVNRSRDGDYMPVFDRNDRGWSGKVPFSERFIGMLNREIERALGIETDIAADHTLAIAQGEMQRVVPQDTLNVLREFPGYPETRWNSARKRFEWWKE